MPNLTLKKIPAALHQRLKARAAAHERSLNSEVIACLKAVVMVEAIDPEALVERARLLRRQVAGRLTDGELARSRAADRP